eukprot:3956009-Pyramimonas_sp.AAC.1
MGAPARGPMAQQVPGKTTSPGNYSLRTARRRARTVRAADSSVSAAGSSLWRREAFPSPSPAPLSAPARSPCSGYYKSISVGYATTGRRRGRGPFPLWPGFRW